MRKNFGAKPWSYPQPVFIIAAYDEAENPDAMNAAWAASATLRRFPSASAPATRR